uniref:RGS domain-containing protein n=1 Tax=Clytia hemisphaerica TaxID=252671 RepID=A0A7M5WRJ7_9CNID
MVNMSMGGGSSAIAPEEQSNRSCEKRSKKSNTSSSTCCGCFSMDGHYSEDEEDIEKRTLREEARSWANNFERLLRHNVGQKVFQEFLQAQFSDENLRFWIEAEKYLNMTEEERMKRAKSLYEDFVSSISPCEVSLDAYHRNQIEKEMDTAPKNLFKNAQDYIYCLMYRDCFPRFLKSKLYKRLCR